MPQAAAFVAVKFGVHLTVKAVAMFVLKTVATVAVSAAATKLSKQKTTAGERQAQATTLSIGEVPREAVFGTCRVGGSLVDIFNFGGKYGTDTVTWCVALADHELDGIEGFYVDEVYYPWVGEGLQAAFSNRLSFHYRPALAGGYDPPEHVRLNSDWTNQDRLCGVAHMWIDVHYDEKVWTQGLPKISFVVRGLRVYSARHDPANGYVGDAPQTWADPTSHRFSTNLIDQRYAFTRGIYAVGHHGEAEHLLIGRGLSEVQAPSARVAAPANICDEVVDGRARYQSAGLIQASLDFYQVEEMFAAACAGVIVQRDGSIEIEPGQAKPALITITDDDLVIGERTQFSAFLPDKDGGRINSVIPRYVEPSQGFKDHAGPVRRDVADIVKDRGPRELTLSLPLVTVAAQADDVAEITRQLARMEKRGEVVLPPRFALIEDGDWIAWQSNRRHKGATVIYRVERRGRGREWRINLSLRQISATAFGGVDVIVNPVPAPPVVVRPLPVDMIEVEIAPVTLDGAASSSPGVRFTWPVPVDDGVIALEAQIRAVGGSEIATSRFEDLVRAPLAEGAPETQSWVVTSGVGGGMALEARLVPIGNATRQVTPTEWTAVTTSPLVSTDTTNVGGRPSGDVIDGLDTLADDLLAAEVFLSAVNEAMLAADEALNAAIEGLDADIAALDIGLGELGDRADNLETVTAALEADKASVTALDAQIARIDDTEAAVIDLDLAIAAESAARAAEIGLVSAGLIRRPNLAPNGGLENGATGWASTGNMPGVWINNQWGPQYTFIGALTTIGWHQLPDTPADGGATYTASLDALLIATDAASYGYLDCTAVDGVGAETLLVSGSPNFATFDFSDANAVGPIKLTATAPTGTVRLRWRWVSVPASGQTIIASGVRRLKVERGSAASAYTPEGTGIQLGASVKSAQEAIVSLDELKAEALDLAATQAELDGIAAETAILQISTASLAEQIGDASVTISAAVGDTPAMLQVRDNRDGSLVAAVAQALFFGNYDGTTIIEVLKMIGGEAFFARPIYIAFPGTSFHLIVGPAGDLATGTLLWFGANTISAEDVTRTNGVMAFGTDGVPYRGSDELSNGGAITDGSGFQRATISGAVSSTSWATLASLTFNGRPANGWWEPLVNGLAGSSDGLADNDIEFEVIESGASTALASGVVTVPAGGAPTLLALELSPPGRLAQTRPAGNLTLTLRARRSSGTGTATFTAGSYDVSYLPGA